MRFQPLSFSLLVLVAALIATITQAQSSCSRTCESPGDTCASETIAGCDASCDANTCSDTVFEGSAVSCTVPQDQSFSEACENAVFNQSSVQLFNTECGGCAFWFSSVTTDGPFGSYSFDQPTFGLCSCCDDTSGSGNCPDGVPSCTDNAAELCSTEVQFRTCKDWGNPVCTDLDVPSLPSKTTADTCSEGVDTVWCKDTGCTSIEVANCTAMCFSASCAEARFNDSVVGCYHYDQYGTESCSDATFDRSFVGLQGSPCEGCEFWFSAVTTDTSFGLYAWDAPLFPFCSCCDDISNSGNCPEGVPSCLANAQDFCASEAHFRTCKDWGNPICIDLDVPSAPAKTTADTCSEGVDTVWCREEGDCEALEVSNCTSICLTGACSEAQFIDSVVGCYPHGDSYSDSCEEATFERSFVDLEGTECKACNFWFSAVTTDDTFGTYSSSAPRFSFCSCCDDISGSRHCPGGIPSCRGNPEEMCAAEAHSKTCKDWGNPVCTDFDIPSVSSWVNASTCSEGLDTVWCRESECEGLASTGCRALCVDDSCVGATFQQSDVGCYLHSGYSDPCRESSFERSLVTLQDSECGSCIFWFSAVTTSSPFSAYSSSQPTFGFCSCCEDTSGEENCPMDVPSCSDPVAFCSTTHLGKSCKEWGNPLCDDVEIVTEEDTDGMLNMTSANMTNVTTDESMPVCPLGDEFVVCTGTDCGGLETEHCTIECYNEACSGVHFEDSSVACLGDDTCTEGTFSRSLVDCTTSNCEDSDFFSSALSCDSSGEDSSYYTSCDYVLLSRCSCCDGGDCPDGAISCPGDPLEFCGNQQFLGRNCKDWGHPLCDDVEVPSLEPLHPAETCSLGEEIYFCDEGDNGCLGLSASSCTVSCHGKVCNQASFEDSFVQCFDRPIPGWFEVFPGESCVNARFLRSVVACQTSCVGATFDDSSVLCWGPSCTQTTFLGCSCCDGDGCPFGVPACEGNLDAICSREIDGETCACRGFPLCGEEYTSSCSNDNPSASSISKTALLDMPIVKTKAVVPNSVAEAKAGKEGAEMKEEMSGAADRSIGFALWSTFLVVSLWLNI